MSEAIPVILFAYARPIHLARVLACLRENMVPLIYVFADGAKDATDRIAVNESRALLHAVDWAELRLVTRSANMGLGANVLDGVSKISEQHEAFIVWEDDLVCAPSTYFWLCEALRYYSMDERVMSITGWTHPRVTPAGVTTEPYFDGRAECWVWGTWARSWRGMEGETALVKMALAAAGGLKPDAYGSDLPAMAYDEKRKNIWAVRWLYHHMQHGGLCLRPPWSMVDHIGEDAIATNCSDSGWMKQLSLCDAPQVPSVWPKVEENPQCARLWRKVASSPGVMQRIKAYWRQLLVRWLNYYNRLNGI
ncbi:MAG: hypothetical protein IPP19_06535 [Verrucomicrobia bacterium]|nr:hypothetical protein [Verrucomicrobiota bacterium]